MNLYRITSPVRGYDTFGGAIVAAPDEDTARRTHPRDGSVYDAPDKAYQYFNAWNQRWDARFDGVAYESVSWRDEWGRPPEVKVELIGVAKEGTKQGVVLASFNAG